LAVVIKSIPDGPNLFDINQAYCDGLQTVWATMCAIAAIGLIASLFTVEHTLEQLEDAVEETKVESSSSGEER
jgi:hypothetical protein